MTVVVVTTRDKGITLPVATKTRRPKKGLGSKPRRDVYAEVTNTIVAQLEAGVGSWRKPWQAIASGPRNVASKKLYRGINALLLAVEAIEKGYTSPTWGTFNQWHQSEPSPLDPTKSRTTRTVRKGEKAATAVLWKPFEKKTTDEAGEEKLNKHLLIRAFAVFNADQVDVITYDADGTAHAAPLKLDQPAPVHTDERVAEAEAFIDATGAVIGHGGNRAYYTPALDQIQLPHFESFESANHYYGTAGHELTHWTGHETRCNRDLKGRFGDNQYGMEELIAELGSAFVCAHLSLESEPRTDHAEYLQSWINTLKADHRAIFTVAAAAQKAADFLIGSADQEEAEEVAA